MRLVISPNLDALAARAAVFLADTLREACARGECTVALAGGSTPAPVYQLLATERVPWERVRFFLGDERCVPESSAESNARMVRENLLTRLPVEPAGFEPIVGAESDPATAAAGYAAKLPDRFDVVLLGLGQDGHTASLFPGSPALAASEKVVVTDGPKPPNPRISVTPPVIRAAREVVVLAAGADKAEAVAAAFDPAREAHEVPATLARDGMWFLDRAAAARLEASTR